jgi:hypothetical protein
VEKRGLNDPTYFATSMLIYLFEIRFRDGRLIFEPEQLQDEIGGGQHFYHSI